ncbi:MAG: hypothetical protein MI745_02230 [Pseudomonadales bacterium]|nr:hypothetical protein [Pseudomonadales bacterium]
MISKADYLGSPDPDIILYLPHRPNGMAGLSARPDAAALVALNSNHWRKIVNLLAKIACPVGGDWRRFRDESLFDTTALCFAPELVRHGGWHWIAGKENRQRFAGLGHQAQPLNGDARVALDSAQRLLLTPYPDYRQLSNALVEQVRVSLAGQGFYREAGQ